MRDRFKKLNAEVTKGFFTQEEYSSYFKTKQAADQADVHEESMRGIDSLYKEEFTYTVKLGDLNSFKRNISHLHADKLAKLDHFLTGKLDQFQSHQELLKSMVSLESIECVLTKQRCFQDFKDILQAEIDSRNTVESVPRNVFDDVSAFLDELQR